MADNIKSERRVLCKFYAYRGEKTMIMAEAEKVKLSFSDYVRRIVVHRKIPTQERNEAIRELLAVNADLARLGNLLVLAIDEEPSLAGLKLLDDIRATQVLLKEKIKQL